MKISFWQTEIAWWFWAVGTCYCVTSLLSSPAPEKLLIFANTVLARGAPWIKPQAAA